MIHTRGYVCIGRERSGGEKEKGQWKKNLMMEMRTGGGPAGDGGECGGVKLHLKIEIVWMSLQSILISFSH